MRRSHAQLVHGAAGAAHECEAAVIGRRTHQRRHCQVGAGLASGAAPTPKSPAARGAPGAAAAAQPDVLVQLGPPVAANSSPRREHVAASRLQEKDGGPRTAQAVPSSSRNSSSCCSSATMAGRACVLVSAGRAHTETGVALKTRRAAPLTQSSRQFAAARTTRGGQSEALVQRRCGERGSDERGRW